VGDRRDLRPPDEVRQDRGDRRPGAVPPPGPPAGALRRLGAWVRAGRLAEAAGGARDDARPAGGPRAESARRGGVLPGRVLVLADRVPAESEFPGTGPEGNGINPIFKSQAEYLAAAEEQLLPGLPPDGEQGDARAAPRARHLRVVRAGVGAAAEGRPGRRGDGGGGAADGARARCGCSPTGPTGSPAGEVPPAPPRPQGIERNVVITMWDWADPKAYLHDLVSTDRRNPTVNANGPVYAVLEASADYMPVLDPKTHTVSRVPVTVRDPNTPAARRSRSRAPRRTGGRGDLDQPGERAQPDVRREGARLDHLQGASAGQPGLLQGGSSHPSAKLFPLNTRAATWRCTTRRRRR
jgi:hypothetical protein